MLLDGQRGLPAWVFLCVARLWRMLASTEGRLHMLLLRPTGSLSPMLSKLPRHVRSNSRRGLAAMASSPIIAHSPVMALEPDLRRAIPEPGRRIAVLPMRYGPIPKLPGISLSGWRSITTFR